MSKAMNWKQAIEQMKLGHHVQRKSEQYRHSVNDHIVETGEEPICLSDAYTADGHQVQVLQGAESKVLFYPRPCHVWAVDWVVVENG